MNIFNSKWRPIAIGLLGILITIVYSMPHTIPNPRFQKPIYCGRDQFRCDSLTECIDLNEECDGIAQCKDKSDETIRQCSRKRCPPFSFQCSYGACIPESKVCNGDSDCIDDSDEKACVSKVPETSPCGKRNFICKSGECIDQYLLCDGMRDCFDGSDETSMACQNMSCMFMNFQCAYGACVNGNAPCNGVADCADASDETEELCSLQGTEQQSNSDGCILPEFPRYGNYSINRNVFLKPGEKVSNSTILSFECIKNYVLNNNSKVMCQNNNWNKPFPECHRTCPPRISSSLDIACSIDGVEVSCDKRMSPNTIAKFQCKPHYKVLVSPSYDSSICVNGKWDQPLYKCSPNQESSTNIINNYNYFVKIFVTPQQLSSVPQNFLNNMNFTNIEVYDLNKYSADFVFPR